jgi:hypothetical protein
MNRDKLSYIFLIAPKKRGARWDKEGLEQMKSKMNELNSN